MPVRKIPIGNRAVTGLHARSGARYESSLERDFFEMMMAHPAVAKIEEQPVQITYIAADGKPHRYTPDALVTFHPSVTTGSTVAPLLCEIKYRDEYKEKFYELRERFQVARRYAREQGWRFRVVTDREIRTSRFANLRFLGGFEDRILDADQARSMLRALRAAGQSSPAALLSTFSSDPWKRADLQIFDAIYPALDPRYQHVLGREHYLGLGIYLAKRCLQIFLKFCEALRKRWVGRVFE